MGTPPSRLDLTTWAPRPFEDRERQAIAQGVRFLTYADVLDNVENRRKLFALEEETQRDMPFRYPDPPEPEPDEWEGFEEWVEEFAKREPTTIELAEIDGQWVGMALGVTWGFVGVARAYRGRGIATALKVRALRAAKARGETLLEIENHADNRSMLAINRKLGYQFAPQEVECIRWLMKCADLPHANR